MSELVYLDSGIFITTALKNMPPTLQALCEDWQKRIQDGKVSAVTSAITWAEVAFTVGKGVENKFDNARAATAGGLIRELPGLRLVPISAELLATAEDILRRGGGRPRDCIHAATAAAEKARLVTADEDFATMAARVPDLGLEVITLREA